jgi:hypothetical protein
MLISRPLFYFWWLLCGEGYYMIVYDKMCVLSEFICLLFAFKSFLSNIKIDTTLIFQDGAAKAKEVLGENINRSLNFF